MVVSVSPVFLYDKHFYEPIKTFYDPFYYLSALTIELDTFYDRL